MSGNDVPPNITDCGNTRPNGTVGLAQTVQMPSPMLTLSDREDCWLRYCARSSSSFDRYVSGHHLVRGKYLDIVAGGLDIEIAELARLFR